MQEWRAIQGVSGAYEVSSGGFIRHAKTGALVTRLLNPAGYWVSRLIIEGAPVTVLVHRVVATSFIANPAALTVVNHIDGDKMNADAENLEWTTPRGNAIHAIATGLRPKRLPSKRVVPISIKMTAEMAAKIARIMERARARLPGYKNHHFLEDAVFALSEGAYVPNPRRELGQNADYKPFWEVAA